MKIKDQAVNAAAKALADSIGHGMREKTYDHARAALEAALPHLLQGAVSGGVIQAACQAVSTGWTLSGEQIERLYREIQTQITTLSPAPVGVTDEGRAEGKREGVEWQPIETAPKGSEMFLAYAPPSSGFPDGRTIIVKGSILTNMMAEGTPNHLAFPATLWMPIPVPSAAIRALVSHEPAPTPQAECSDCESPLNEDGDCLRDLAEREADDLAEAQSALTACQQEVETLRKVAEREQSIRDNWDRYEAKAGARIAELETDLEIERDKLRNAEGYSTYLNKELHRSDTSNAELVDDSLTQTVELKAVKDRNAELTELLHNALAVGLPDEVATPIRAVLGGQSNG